MGFFLLFFQRVAANFYGGAKWLADSIIDLLQRKKTQALINPIHILNVYRCIDLYRYTYRYISHMYMYIYIIYTHMHFTEMKFVNKDCGPPQILETYDMFQVLAETAIPWEDDVKVPNISPSST